MEHNLVFLLNIERNGVKTLRSCVSFTSILDAGATIRSDMFPELNVETFPSMQSDMFLDAGVTARSVQSFVKLF